MCLISLSTAAASRGSLIFMAQPRDLAPGHVSRNLFATAAAARAAAAAAAAFLFYLILCPAHVTGLCNQSSAEKLSPHLHPCFPYRSKSRT